MECICQCVQLHMPGDRECSAGVRYHHNNSWLCETDSVPCGAALAFGTDPSEFKPITTTTDRHPHPHPDKQTDRRTHRHTHTRHTRTHARTHARSLTHTRTHARTHAPTPPHQHTHTHARTHARTHAHMGANKSGSTGKKESLQWFCMENPAPHPHPHPFTPT